MKPEDRAYILQNAGKMTVAQMAQHLGLKERTVRRFLEGRQKTPPAAAGGLRPRAKGLGWSIILIVVLGAAVHANSVGGDFIWDDEHLVQNNTYIRNPANFIGLFTKKEIRKEYAFYRPLQEASYALDYALWRGNAAGYHLTNIALHIGVALCVFWLMNLLFGRVFLSLVAAGLFCVHPAHTEAVAYISGRADPLVSLFLLLSFILYVKQTERRDLEPWLLGAMLLSYACALLSRENSLILPVLLTFYHAVFKKGRPGAPLFAVWGAAASYVLVRLTLLRFFLTLPEAQTSVWQRLPGSFVALTQYLRLLVAPFGLHMEYGMGVFPWSDVRAPAGAALLLALIFYAFKKRGSAPLITFFIGWFFLTLLPQANLLPVNAYMSEHWLYLPSIGFFVLLAAGLDKLYQRRSKGLAAAAAAGIGLFFAALTVQQNNYWNDPFLFYEKTLAYAPQSARLLNNLGILTYEKGDAKKATALFEKAIAAEPDYIEAYNNLGNIHKDAGRFDEATALFTKAIALDPNYAEAYNNLAIVAFLEGQPERAIPLFEKAIALQPDFGKAYFNLAAALFQLKKYGLAARYYDKAVELGVSNPAFAERLGRAR